MNKSLGRLVIGVPVSRKTNSGPIAGNPNTPASALEKLAADENEGVRRIVARNPNTPASALEKVAADEDEDVRKGVAGNPNTPASAL